MQKQSWIEALQSNLTRVLTRAASTGLIVMAATACMINPATGKREFSLVSESQEIALGLQNDKVILQQMGEYDDTELQSYLQSLGDALAQVSERPNLEWKFTVVDDPLVNAFALPGGFIYITRGIMAHLENEAQLASIVGHEIGHVTARHGASQMSRAQLAQLGLGLGTVLAPEAAQRWGGMAQQGLSVLFLKYGRDDEYQADDLGLRYIDRVQYDPRPMPNVFLTLKRVSEAAGATPLPTWMSTHPAPQDRHDRLERRIATSGVDYDGRAVERESYLRRLEGMVFGPDPRQGYFEDSLFLHPEMAFQLRFPGGWRTQNQRAAVVGISQEQDAMLQLTLAGVATAAEAQTAFFAGQGIQRGNAWRSNINGKRTASSYFRVVSQQGTLDGLAAWIEHNDSVFQLLAYSPNTQWPGYKGAIENALLSFNQVTDRRVLDVQPARLRIVRAPRSQSIEQFLAAQNSSTDAQTFALINQLDPGAGVRSGTLYKVPKGGPR